MRNKDALIIANSLLCEIRLLLNQEKFDQAQRVAEIGRILPTDEGNYTREALVYDRLFEYVNEHPDRPQLLHFHELVNIQTDLAKSA